MNRMTWSDILQSKDARRRDGMRAPVLVSVVVAVHVMAIGAVMFIQGCGTRRAGVVEPPPAPVMPPKDVTAPDDAVVLAPPRPVFQPPSPIESAPTMAVPSAGKTYVVQNGDSLSKIANKVGVSSREIAELNGIKDANKIRVGQKLMLPGYTGTTTSSKPKTSAPAKKSAPKAEPVISGDAYVVKSGDSLSKIASKHGVKVSALRAANPKLKGDKIMIGQKLAIPGAVAAAPKAESTAAPAPVVEPAAAIETLPVPAPEAAMPAAEPAVLQPVAPAPVMDAPAAPAPMSSESALDYSVQEGDTLDSIAKIFIVSKEDIMRLNNIVDPQGVKPGQKLKIPPTML